MVIPTWKLNTIWKLDVGGMAVCVRGAPVVYLESIIYHKFFPKI